MPEDESYLNKRGLTHFWENIDDIKQDKLTAGAGISITGNTISATGGGVADSVAWGHITGTLTDQTDLNTALGLKANTADLATVATSGSYNDLTNKPIIPSLTSRTSASTPATVGSLVLGGNGTSTLPYAFPTIVGSTNDESFWSYIRTTDITNGISEAYLGAYEFDPTESWWSGKKEARLALYSDIPTVPTKTSDLTNDSGFLTSVAWGDVTGKPTFAMVATSGSYNDLSNKPTIPAAQVNSDWNAASGVAQILNKPNLATVATSGDYDDLTGKPTIGNATLTIQKNGTSAGTFTANATSNKTINITVPTTAADVSALPASTKYGASIAVSINTTDYKVTTTLKDQDGNTLGTAQVIDLPLESVVVNGSYDSTNKKIVLTLQNGNTIDIPVADLVAGLQSEITSTNMLDADLVDDSTSTNKFVTAAQITKLNGIAAGAEVNVQSDWNVTSTTSDAYIKNKPTIPSSYRLGVASGNTDTQVSVPFTTLLHLKAGDNVGLSTASGTGYRDVTIDAIVPTKTSELTNDSGFLDSVAWGDVTGKPTFATVATSGSYDDLSDKPTIPAAQVNSDWNATSGKAQILNKPTLATVATTGAYSDLTGTPTIPTVNNATLTIQKNGTNVQTFTANQSTNATANITVPTATSDLTNDGADGTDTYVETADIANFITAEDIASTSALTPPVQTNMIADGAVTSDKLGWSTFDNYSKQTTYTSTTYVAAALMTASTVAESGKYLVIGDMSVHPNGYDYRVLNIIVNGTRSSYGLQAYQDQRFHLSINGIIDLDAGDTVTIGMYANSANFYPLVGTYSVVRVG